MPFRLQEILLLFLLTTGLASAAEFIVSRSANGLLENIPAVCPECGANGYTACGDDKIGFGKTFSRHVWLGHPARGYLLDGAVSAAELRQLIAGESNLPQRKAALEARYAKLRLLVLETGFSSVRLLGVPEQVKVDIPIPLQVCLADMGKRWGCCVANACHDECCEKDLGSPVIALSWNDKATGEQLRYSGTNLRRFSRGGSELYWCLPETGRLVVRER